MANAFVEELNGKIEEMAKRVEADGQTFAIKQDGDVFVNTKALVVFSTAYLMNSITALVSGDKQISDLHAKVSLLLSSVVEQANKSV